MGIRHDWWHEEFIKGDPGAQMGGGDGREGVPHPTHTWLSGYIPEFSSLLDVGCCNAHTLESFNRANKQIDYYGVDHLQELIDFCIERHPEARFSVSDAADLQDFEDESFDYVLSRHVAEHQNHYSQHFMEMWRVAKKEVIVVGFLELKDEFDILQYGVKDNGKFLPHWYNQYSKPQMEAFIKHNMTSDFEWIDDFKDIGHPVLIIRKPHES